MVDFRLSFSTAVIEEVTKENNIRAAFGALSCLVESH